MCLVDRVYATISLIMQTYLCLSVLSQKYILTATFICKEI